MLVKVLESLVCWWAWIERVFDVQSNLANAHQTTTPTAAAAETSFGAIVQRECGDSHSIRLSRQIWRFFYDYFAHSNMMILMWCYLWMSSTAKVISELLLWQPSSWIVFGVCVLFEIVMECNKRILNAYGSRSKRQWQTDYFMLAHKSRKTTRARKKSTHSKTTSGVVQSADFFAGISTSTTFDVVRFDCM